MREELPKEYMIDYHIQNDNLVSVVVTCGDKEDYIPRYELEMLLAEYVWKGWKL